VHLRRDHDLAVEIADLALGIDARNVPLALRPPRKVSVTVWPTARSSARKTWRCRRRSGGSPRARLQKWIIAT
jgi:hypothetical protein